MIITLKVTLQFESKIFLLFCYIQSGPLWAASGGKALVRYARTEGHKRALWPLYQSVDNAGWASQHVSAPARCCRIASMGGKTKPGDKEARTRYTYAQMHRCTDAQSECPSLPTKPATAPTTLMATRTTSTTRTSTTAHHVMSLQDCDVNCISNLALMVSVK